MDDLDSLKTAYYDSRDYDSLDQHVADTYLSNAAEKERTERLISLIPPEVESVLDVGAGFGVFLHEALKRRELRAEGVDVSKEKMNWGLSRGLKLQFASAHKLPYSDRSFDLIGCSEVLEHLTWGVYEQALTELSRVADRYILISVPYDERRGFAKCPYCGCRVHPEYHMRSFPSERLDGLFPHFELVTRETVCSLSVLTMLKPYLPLPWHSELVCPACNYHSAANSAKAKSSRLAKVKSALRSLPLPQRPRWLVGLYQRA